MPMTEPVLTKRIPSAPFGNPSDRKTIDINEYRRTGGYEGLARAIELGPQVVIEMVKDSGLRGRGGAGFPCGLKWTFLPKDYEGKRYLAVNADESEPGTFKDRLLIDYDPHQMLEGIAITCFACQLHTAYIYIRGEYHEQAIILQKAIDEAYEAGIFGKNGLMGGKAEIKVDCYMHRGAGAYVCGEETGLLESIEGKRGWPRVKPPFPAIKGLFGKPTIINNVETLSCVPHIVLNGVDWFQGLGCASTIGGPPSYGTKLMGVSGHVNNPGVFECDLGVPLRMLVEDLAGGMRNGKKFKGAIPGGVSMGILGPDELDAEMDFDIGRKYGCLGLGTACPTVFDEDTDMVMVARNIMRFFSNESCGQCTPCREGSAWMYKILCRIENGDGTTRDLDILDEVAGCMGAMPGTTICGLADGSSWAVKTILKKFRGEFEARVKTVGVAIPVTISKNVKTQETVTAT